MPILTTIANIVNLCVLLEIKFNPSIFTHLTSFAEGKLESSSSSVTGESELCMAAGEGTALGVVEAVAEFIRFSMDNTP